MAEFFKGLDVKPIPDARDLNYARDYQVAYRDKYNEAARALIEAANRLTAVRQTTGHRTHDLEQLARLSVKFKPDIYVAEPVRYVNSKEMRFDPDESNTREIYLPTAQAQDLINELERTIGGDAINIGGVPSVVVYHAFNLIRGDPRENIQLYFSREGKAYKPFHQDQLMVVPEPQPVSMIAQINDALSSFDATEPGVLIPLGRNRLALMIAAEHYLVDELGRHSERHADILKRLKDLQT